MISVYNLFTNLLLYYIQIDNTCENYFIYPNLQNYDP